MPSYRAIIVVIMIVFVGVGLLVWNFDQPPLSENKMKLIRVGMSQDDILRILGKPNETNDWQWAYTRPLGWGAFKVSFDKNGKVKNFDLDN